MAEEILTSILYSLERNELKSEEEKELQETISFFNERKETIIKNWDGLFAYLKQKCDDEKLETKDKFINPGLYLKNFLNDAKNSFQREKICELKEKMEEKYKNSGLININSFKEDIEKILNEMEKEKTERLSCLEKNLESEIKNIKAKYGPKIEEIEKLLKNAEEIAKNCGLNLEFTETHLKLKKPLNEPFSFSAYLEKLVNTGITVKEWKLDNTYQARIEAGKQELFLEYQSSPENCLSLYIPLNFERNDKVVEVVKSMMEVGKEEKALPTKTEEQKKGFGLRKYFRF